MEDGTAEEEKRMHSTEQDQQLSTNSEKQVNWKKKVGSKKNDSDKGDSNKTSNKSKGPNGMPKSNNGDRKRMTSMTLPAISEAPKEKEQEICQPPSQKSQESQDKNKNTSGSRTNGRETRRNALPNRDRRHINRRLTNVRSDWQEFKLISFNVRGLNSESKQKIIYDLLKHNRP
jgi:hypothetical protein